MPDYDGDLLPGLTIKSSNGDDTGDARRSQTWRRPLAGPLVLNGPVTLHLSSAQSGNGTAYAYLYDCTAGGASCTQIGYGTVSDNPWNGLLSWGRPRHLARRRQPHAARRATSCASGSTPGTAISAWR